MTKKRKLSITTLAFASAAALVSAAALMGGTLAADADREIQLTGTNYFYTSNQAEIGEYDGGNNAYYTSFVFADGDSAITYRKNLAYHWFGSVKDSDGNPTAEGAEGYLSTEIGFDSVTFETFTIKFQSQQYAQTEDGVSDNYITFIAGEGDSVYVKIGEPLAEDSTERAEEIETIVSDSSSVALSSERLTINFSDYASGVYQVSVSDGSATASGEFSNVGGSYSRYVSSSSSTSVIPLTYSAQFADDATEAATMILYSFNGQSFELTGDAGERVVTDDTSPVLCLNEQLTSIEYGRSVDVDYVAIDMLATSPRAYLYYYIPTDEQLAAGDLNSTEEGGNFISVSSSDVSPVIRGNGTFVPDDDGTDGYSTECLVKIYYHIQDSTATGNNSDDVFLEWYVPAEYRYTYTATDGTPTDFIRAVDDGEGATYTATDASGYQALVDQAITDQDATAGDNNSFYLPSFEDYISDNITAYNDLTFSVYYKAGESGSATSLDANELAIELSQEGMYIFAIYATDAAGNEMYYINDDGEKVTFSASELADLLDDPASSSLSGHVPVFSFTVNYGGLTVTDPEGQDIGYVGTSYTASSFEISGLSSNYTTTYSLYLFNRQDYTRDHGAISYSQFISRVSELFNDPETRQYFQTIPALSDMEETDAEYETYSDYEWNPDSRSFIPQDDNSFYVIRMSASDNIYSTADIESFMAISVSAAADTLPGESDWLANNVASVVLLCIAGVALIGIVLLIVIKPKEKGDIDLVEETPAKRVSARKKLRK